MTEESKPRRPRRTARRAAAALALAGVATLALAACEVQPGAAAFVGGDRISRSQVDQATDHVPRGQTDQIDFTKLRTKTVAALIVANLTDRLAREQGLTVKTPDYQSAASGIGLPASNGYVRAVAQADAGIDALRSVAEPRQLSQDDLRELFNELVQTGALDPTSSLDQYQKLLDTREAEQSVVVRDELAAAVKKYHVTINPLYGQLVYYVTVPYTPQIAGALQVKLGGTAAASASPTASSGE